jgi:hypothetical protein
MPPTLLHHLLTHGAPPPREMTHVSRHDLTGTRHSARVSIESRRSAAALAVRARPLHVAPAARGGLDRQPAGQLTAQWKPSPTGRPVASWSLQPARSFSATWARTQTTQLERTREASLTTVARRFFWAALVAVVCWVGLLAGAGSALATIS